MFRNTQMLPNNLMTYETCHDDSYSKTLTQRLCLYTAICGGVSRVDVNRNTV
jgi:hypothetical protein